MATRHGITVRVDIPTAESISPNLYLPHVTAEIRLFWPTQATELEVNMALVKALQEAATKYHEAIDAD